MVIPRLWIGGTSRDEQKARTGRPVQTVSDDPALKLLLDRRDERLLRDVGLTRDDLLGPSGSFWQEWARRPRHRML